MKKALQVLNVLTLLFTLAVNYFFNSGAYIATSMKSISSKYDNLLTPAGYAFSIWGLVYIALIGFAIYQARSLFRKDVEDDFVSKIGIWFIVANLANAGWVTAFTHDQIGLSLVIMIVLFIALLKIVLNLNMEKWDAPFITILAIWWPFSLYFGWINVALIANVAIYLVSIGYTGSPIGPDAWAIVVLLIALAVFITMVWTRNMREYATAAVWGIIAIAVKNWEVNPLVSYVAIFVSVVVLINTMVHGYKNRAMGPIRSLRPKVK
jgi:hypothetical protein